MATVRLGERNALVRCVVYLVGLRLRFRGCGHPPPTPASQPAENMCSVPMSYVVATFAESCERQRIRTTERPIGQTDGFEHKQHECMQARVRLHCIQ